mgnify:CR=1 FL=1
MGGGGRTIITPCCGGGDDEQRELNLFASLAEVGVKDLEGLARKLVPLADGWYCCDLPVGRAASAQTLAEQVRAAREAGGSATLPPAQISTHADPMAALHAALAASDPADRIVVFGSFYTVGGVLHDGLPRLNAPHLPGDDQASGL